MGEAWRFLKDNDRPLLVVFAIVGGLYGIIEYELKSRADRVQASSRFVEFYGSSEVLKARTDFSSFMNSAEVRALKPDTFDSYMQAKIDNDRIFRDVEVQLTFFDSLSICTTDGACNQDTACKYFFRDAQAFIQNTKPLLAEMSRRNNEPADRLIRRFAHQICKEQHKNYCSIIAYAGTDCVAYRPTY